MATLREVKSRISAVQNIQKIADTMEKISTAKIKKNGDRLIITRDYNNNLGSVVQNLLLFIKGELLYKSSPLLSRVEKKDSKKSVLLLIVTSNRGLCGGYNQNVLSLAQQTHDELKSSGKVINYVIGKKGSNALRYRGIPADESFLDINDDVPFATMSSIADKVISLYLKEEVDEVKLVYTKHYSNSRQTPIVEQLLPFKLKDRKADNKDEQLDIEKEKKTYRDVYLSEPNLDIILDEILPLRIRMRLFYMILETNLSEQIARRAAMKQASDSAKDIIKALSLAHNRARQTKITREIIEIVGAAKALQR